jgi:folylpolyglutamate synthase/dihydropteroate synthase
MADKNWEGMLERLKPFIVRLVATRPSARRAADPDFIASRARAMGLQSATVVEPPIAALREAWREHPSVLVAGSIFLVGELLPLRASG